MNWSTLHRFLKYISGQVITFYFLTVVTMVKRMFYMRIPSTVRTLLAFFTWAELGATFATIRLQLRGTKQTQNKSAKHRNIASGQTNVNMSLQTKHNCV